MNVPEKQDLRVQKTLDAIQSTFEAMICEMSFSKMTVKELCDRARINKKTFYRYYDDLFDLLAVTQNHMSEEFLERISNYEIPRDLQQIGREFFLFSTEKGAAYERITCSSTYAPIRNEMVDSVMNARWRQSPQIAKLPTEEQNVIISFVTATGLEIYKQWVEDGKKIPLERIIQIYNTLLCRGVEGLGLTVR